MAELNLASFQSPGVYVKEVPSQIKAITGVSTSTAGFIGFPAGQQTKKIKDSFTADGTATSFALSQSPVNTSPGSFSVTVGGTANTTASISKSNNKFSLKLSSAPASNTPVIIEYDVLVSNPATAVLCTNFGEFKRSFPDFFEEDIAKSPNNFSTNDDANNLAQAVYGFFNNGGSRCYVIFTEKLEDALAEFEKIDEIAVIAAPGKTDPATHSALISHCEKQDGIFYRVAILDGIATASEVTTAKITQTNNSQYAALYFPWLKVADPKNPKSLIDAPPSGHIAGIYARVDNDRGVHKAPANEAIRGALGVSQLLSKPQQDGLNPDGINCIRILNGNILVWGARTIGGDKNADLKYINVRRTLLFLRKSIDQSTQWVVFEPNTPALWQKIIRNVSAFLTTVWRSGALFGNTPEEAFYVRCDEVTNPPEAREKGAVVTEIGVAIARPAEFVVFQISQWTGPGQ